MAYKAEWITTGEAGKRLGYTSQHIRNMCRGKKVIHKISDEGKFLVSAQDVDRLLNEELERGWAGYCQKSPVSPKEVDDAI